MPAASYSPNIYLQAAANFGLGPRRGMGNEVAIDKLNARDDKTLPAGRGIWVFSGFD